MCSKGKEIVGAYECINKNEEKDDEEAYEDDVIYFKNLFNNIND